MRARANRTTRHAKRVMLCDQQEPRHSDSATSQYHTIRAAAASLVIGLTQQARLLEPGLNGDLLRLLSGCRPLLEPACHGKKRIAHPTGNSGGCQQPVTSCPLSQLGRAQFLDRLMGATIHKAFVKEITMRRLLTICYLQADVAGAECQAPTRIVARVVALACRIGTIA